MSTQMVRGSGSSWTMGPSQYDFDQRGFADQKDTTRPTFYMDKRPNPKTGELEDVEMFRVLSPGENLNIMGGEVTDQHRERWPQFYEAFKRNETLATGTPLSKWPELASNLDFVTQLQAFRFFTVEDVAGMNDSAHRLFPGALTWCRKAQAWLVAQRRINDALAQKDAGDAKDKAIADLQAQIVALAEKMNASGPVERVRRKRGPNKKKALPPVEIAPVVSAA